MNAGLEYYDNIKKIHPWKIVIGRSLSREKRRVWLKEALRTTNFNKTKDSLGISISFNNQSIIHSWKEKGNLQHNLSCPMNTSKQVPCHQVKILPSPMFSGQVCAKFQVRHFIICGTLGWILGPYMDYVDWQ